MTIIIDHINHNNHNLYLSYSFTSLINYIIIYSSMISFDYYNLFICRVPTTEEFKSFLNEKNDSFDENKENKK